MTPLEAAKAALRLPELMHRLGLGDHVRKSAKCPVHEDRRNSFSLFVTASDEPRPCAACRIAVDNSNLGGHEDGSAFTGRVWCESCADGGKGGAQ